jgi:hypothetical protein
MLNNAYLKKETKKMKKNQRKRGKKCNSRTKGSLSKGSHVEQMKNLALES